MTEIQPRDFWPYEGCSEAVLDTLDYLGVDPYYHLVALTLARSVHAGPLRVKALQAEMGDMAPEEEPPAIGTITKTVRLLANMLEPQVDITRAKDTNAYEMNEEGYRTAGALAETILSWQADNDLPLGEVWSAERKITSRPSREYFAIFRMLSTYPDGVSLADLDAVIALNFPSRSAASVIKRQLNLGVVAAETESERIFRLTDRWLEPIGELGERIATLGNSYPPTEKLQEKIETLASNPQKIGKLLRLGAQLARQP